MIVLGGGCSINQGQADEETEQNLRVLEASHQQLVQRILQLLLVHFLWVHKHVRVHFDLHRQDLDLIGRDLELVRLAIELQAIYRLETETVL